MLNDKDRPQSAPSDVTLVQQNISFFELPLEIRRMIYIQTDLAQPLIMGCTQIDRYKPSPLARTCQCILTEVFTCFSSVPRGPPVNFRFNTSCTSWQQGSYLEAATTEELRLSLRGPASRLFHFRSIQVDLWGCLYQLMRLPSGKVFIHEFQRRSANDHCSILSASEFQDMARKAKQAVLRSMEQAGGRGISLTEIEIMVDEVNKAVKARNQEEDSTQLRGNEPPSV
ncbi:Hypothetical protein D9617_2g053470 [Elsinoe fawcettii]|nr:Hypothetical protein D9617_2g053470 [Elsinoe fawcettii]